MGDIQSFYTLNSEQSSLVIDCRNNAAAILYWGPRLSESTNAGMLAALATRQRAPARAEIEAPVSLSPELGAGFTGSAGIRVHRDGRQWGVYSRIEAVTREPDNRLRIASVCDATRIGIVHWLGLDEASNVLTASTEISNGGDSMLAVDFCGAPTVPVAPHFDRILGFAGRWSGEFRLQNVERFTGCYLRENRAGRTSHDTFPGVVLHTQHTSESGGAAFALHLGWSGNHSLRVDELSDGRSYAQLGEWFYPGELCLEPGESYRSPTLYGAHSDEGFSGLSQRLHRYVRQNLTASRMRGRTKLVHFNTWEAVYFDLSLETLCRLADAAADVGAERFVLDDGWFRNRRSDESGLGDWYVDETVFPDGLQPLVEHVNGRSMDFGLWVEPEMVNADSDLFRSHPEWVLDAAPAPLLAARHQFVLDLTRAEVRDHLFECLDALLRAFPIRYLKWDMNRDISQPGGRDGRPVTHLQTLAFYELLQRVREAHPEVEIESCSSGGGRADFGVLAHVDRIWTSDNNDALDRLRIQKGFSFFFPAEFMGAHVGPATCHVSGRHIGMAMRAGVAMFGDMGVEADLLAMSQAEKDELTAAVALHKKHRELIFDGDLFRLDSEDHEIGFGIVSRDRRQALFTYALLDTPPHSAPGRYRFRGLLPDELYAVTIAWPQETRSYSTSILDVIAGAPVSGDALMEAGMQLPILPPQSILILHLQRAD